MAVSAKLRSLLRSDGGSGSAASGVHLEARSLSPADRKRYSRGVSERLARAEGVYWARHNGPLGRVVVSFDPARTDAAALAFRLEQLERRHGMSAAPFASDPPEHPGDVEPLLRALVEGLADLGGLALGSALVRCAPPSSRCTSTWTP